MASYFLMYKLFFIYKNARKPNVKMYIFSNRRIANVQVFDIFTFSII